MNNRIARSLPIALAVILTACGNPTPDSAIQTEDSHRRLACSTVRSAGPVTGSAFMPASGSFGTSSFERMIIDDKLQAVVYIDETETSSVSFAAIVPNREVSDELLKNRDYVRSIALSFEEAATSDCFYLRNYHDGAYQTVSCQAVK